MPIRLMNSLARRSSPVFDWLVSLQMEDLLEAATRRTRLQDWGDPRLKEAMAALLDSVNAEGKLTFFGRFSLRQFLIGNLASRLRTIEVFHYRLVSNRHHPSSQPVCASSGSAGPAFLGTAPSLPYPESKDRRS
jgi:hypothetical protein